MEQDRESRHNDSGVKPRQAITPTPPPKQQAHDSPRGHGRMSTRQQAAPLRLAAVQDTISTVLSQLDSKRAIEDHAKHTYKSSPLRSPVSAGRTELNKQPTTRSSSSCGPGSPAVHSAPENDALSPIPELTDFPGMRVTEVADLSGHTSLNQSTASVMSMSKLNLHGARLEDEHANAGREGSQRRRPMSGNGARVFMYQRAAEAGMCYNDDDDDDYDDDEWIIIICACLLRTSHTYLRSCTAYRRTGRTT
jgi:hypothetical protein